MARPVNAIVAVAPLCVDVREWPPEAPPPDAPDQRPVQVSAAEVSSTRRGENVVVVAQPLARDDTRMRSRARYPWPHASPRSLARVSGVRSFAVLHAPPSRWT